MSKERVPGFDDIIFEHRNKEYGAYQLRSRYDRSLVAGIIIATLAFSLAVVIPFLDKPENDLVYAGGGRGGVMVEMEYYEPPPERVYVPPAPPPTETQPVVTEVLKYVAPVIVDSVSPVDLLPEATDLIIQSDVITELEGPGGSGGYGDDIFDGEGGFGQGEPMFIVEIMPSFRGGDINKFREWVQKRTTYPQEAIDKKIQGRVYLTFIVETDGSVSNVTVVKGVHPLIDNEAVAAIQSSPKWSPGLQRGQPVRVRFSMWLNFIF